MDVGADWELQSSITYGGSQTNLNLGTFFGDTGFIPAPLYKNLNVIL